MASPRESATRTKAEGWVPELEGLRGVLAWTVVAGHLLICSGWFGPIFRGARVLNEISESAVDVFMLLSGFAITRLLVVQRESYGAYLTRRAFRIFPAYWLALIAGIFCNAWLAANFRHLAPTADATAYAQICDIGAQRIWTDGILHTFLVHGLAPASVLPAEPYTFLGVAWSLSLEWQFYLLGPVILWFACKRRFNAFLLAVAVVILALFSTRMIAAFSNAFLPTKAAFFFVGALSYFEFEQSRKNRPALRWLFGLCFGLTLFWQFGSGRILESWLPALVWFFTLASARFGWLRNWQRFLDSLPLQFLGKISYSTYLLHVPVITVVQFAIWRWHSPTSPRELLVLTTVAAAPAALLVSWLSWRWVERPGQKLGRALTR